MREVANDEDHVAKPPDYNFPQIFTTILLLIWLRAASTGKSEYQGSYQLCNCTLL